MDANRFDALARALSAPATRRGLLRLLGALPLVGALAAIGGGEEAAAREGALDGTLGGRHDKNQRGRDKDRNHGDRKEQGQHKGKKRPPSSHCVEIQHTCTPDESVCCDGLTCFIPRDDCSDANEVCCGFPGHACEEHCDCCVGMECGSERKCCRPDGKDCVRDVECCPGLVCGDAALCVQAT